MGLQIQCEKKAPKVDMKYIQTVKKYAVFSSLGEKNYSLAILCGFHTIHMHIYGPNTYYLLGWRFSLFYMHFFLSTDTMMNTEDRSCNYIIVLHVLFYFWELMLKNRVHIFLRNSNGMYTEYSRTPLVDL